MHRLVLILLLICGVCSLASAAESPKQGPRELLTAATTRAWPGENFPVLPSLSTEMRGRITAELGREPVRRAFELLDARQKRNVDWFKAVEILSENATIHGIVHESIVKTLSAITGVEVRLDGQDPEGLGTRTGTRLVVVSATIA